MWCVCRIKFARLEFGRWNENVTFALAKKNRFICFVPYFDFPWRRWDEGSSPDSHEQISRWNIDVVDITPLLKVMRWSVIRLTKPHQWPDCCSTALSAFDLAVILLTFHSLTLSFLIFLIHFFAVGFGSCGVWFVCLFVGFFFQTTHRFLDLLRDGILANSLVLVQVVCVLSRCRMNVYVRAQICHHTQIWVEHSFFKTNQCIHGETIYIIYS